jgi:hypothetical protein
MHLAISINIHGIKEVPQLQLLTELRREEFLDVIKCNVAVIVAIDLEKYSAEPFRLFLVDLSPVRDYVQHALPE